MENKMYKTYLEKLEEITSKAKEVKKDKVELALIDDIDKLVDKGVKQYRSSEKGLRAAADKLLKSGTEFQSAKKKIVEALKMAKELGSKEAIKMYGNRLDEVNSYINELESAYNKIIKAVNSL
jgi:phage-related protein